MLPVRAVWVNERTVLVSPEVAVGLAAAAFGLFARVSSHDQKSDVDRQVARLTGWAAEAGATVVRVKAEVGSGMNGSRPMVRRLWRSWMSRGGRCGRGLDGGRRHDHPA
jgi:putative resolvase